MKLNTLLNNKHSKNLFTAIFTGLLSYFFSYMNFYIPGIDGATSNFNEIPLLIGIFYLSNPLYLIIASFITSFGTAADGSFISTFLMHTGALIIIWFIYNKIKAFKANSTVFATLWLFIVAFYYLVIIALMVLTNYLVGINLDKNFLEFYTEMLLFVQFEAATSGVISALYLVQYKIRLKLIQHQENLEIVVKERTKDLYDTIEELETTQKQLVESEKMASLGVLSAGIAHEINNPLNFIQGGVYSLENFVEENNLKDNSTILFIIKSINTGITRATDIVSGLNQFSRKSKSVHELIKVDEIINNCLLMLHNKLKKKVEVKLYYCDKPYKLYGNEGRLHQAILNIISNAEQSIDEKGIISIETKVNNEMLEIIFSDNGSGMNEEILSKITEPFFTTKSPGDGTGLGLSITYSIIQEHEGVLEFNSVLGEGTKVVVSLPLKSS